MERAVAKKQVLICRMDNEAAARERRADQSQHSWAVKSTAARGRNLAWHYPVRVFLLKPDLSKCFVQL